MVNYDLPWNPQRIEQRIGRCHRYGQKHDVVVINFLNERNEADRRVLELLTEKFSLFSGVFGASDDVLGSIESGVDFEKRILAIYQECRTPQEIDAAFKALQDEMEEQIRSRLDDTRRALFEHFDEDVHQRMRMQLADAKAQLDRVGQRFWSLTRGEPAIVWKYFQYLTLLFTELYLDRYFTDPNGLLKALNAQVVAYNADKPDPDQIGLLDEQADAWSQLNKVAYWSATGSGKTLLMHANILQYQHYLDKHGRRRELNRILLLTPNEGLSLQHLREFETAGIPAELFNKDGRGLFAGHAVEILDIHKLKDEMGDKTIAIDAFEGNNLVLVDEGHRGASAGEESEYDR